MYRYPMSQMGGSIVNINHFENKDRYTLDTMGTVTTFMWSMDILFAEVCAFGSGKL